MSLFQLVCVHCDYLALCLSLTKILNLHCAIQPCLALVFIKMNRFNYPHFIGQVTVSFWGKGTRLKPPTP